MTKTRTRLAGQALCCAASLMMLAPASSAEPSTDSSLKQSRRAKDDKRIYFRAGPLHMIANAKSKEAVLESVQGPASLGVMDGPIAGSRVDIDSTTLPAAIIGYRWPLATGEFAVETVLAPPVTLTVTAGGSLADESIAPTVLDSVPTGIPALGTELGNTKALPPVVTGVYRHAVTSRLRPYVGAGVSYLYTYDGKITNPVLTEVVAPRFDTGDGWSAVVQGGLDVRLDRFSIMIDIKYMTGFNIKGQVRDIYVRSSAIPLFDAVHVGDATLEVRASPLIMQVGAGLDF